MNYYHRMANNYKLWKTIINYIGVIPLMKQRFDLVCRDAYDFMCESDFWYDFCRPGKLGYLTEDEFKKNRLNHNWFLEYRQYSLDNYLRKKAIHVVINQKKNIFITGSAGSGKSHFLKQIVEELDKKNIPYDITAYTGVSAFLIGGCTIHNWAGLGLLQEDIKPVIGKYLNVYKQYNELKKEKKPFTSNILKNMFMIKLIEKWKFSKVLIIDEISMLPPDFFLKLEQFARAIRNRGEFFGGIQLVLFGDFSQLQSIQKDKKQPSSSESLTYDHLFQMPGWKKNITEVINLKYPHRQKFDSKFLELLNRVRFAEHTFDDIKLLDTRRIESINEYPKALNLYSLKIDVEIINNERLEKINEEFHDFNMTFEFKGFNSKFEELNMKKNIIKQSPIPENLKLKKGCKVMLVINLDVSSGLVNGSCGEIKRFNSVGLPIIQFDTALKKINYYTWKYKDKSLGTEVTYKQLPLRVAYAVTIHKSQGMTLDQVNMELSTVFSPGQCYTALSRAKTLEGLHIVKFKSSCIIADPNVVEYYKNLEKNDPYKIKPKPWHKMSIIPPWQSAERHRDIKLILADDKETYLRETILPNGNNIINLQQKQEEKKKESIPNKDALTKRYHEFIKEQDEKKKTINANGNNTSKPEKVSARFSEFMAKRGKNVSSSNNNIIDLALKKIKTETKNF